MQHIIRFKFALLLVICLSATAGAANPTPKQAEYKRSDTNFYWKGDVLKVDPNAVIITQGKYTQKGDSYFIDAKGKPAKEIYISVENDWIEPITPPTMPTSLGVAPDAMQIREPQGDVTVALPSAPANFIPVQNNMDIPNGAVIKTGANGTTAVLIGGVNSIRLIPNSAAAVEQTVTPVLRSTTVNLTTGAVFSKVGKRIGEKQDYQVHTPFGVAAARGTDFVTIAMPARTDVWIAQGTVQLDQLDGKVVGTVSSEGTGALKIIRNPAMPDAHAAMMASAQTMTAAMNFIPTVNVYVKALDDKMAQGIKLSPTERDYLNRIKKVPCLIKLSLVEPPAPPPVPPPAPKLAPAAVIAPVPAATPAPEAAATPAKTTKPATPPLKVQIEVAADGSTKLNGVPVETDAALAASLDGIAKNNPAQSVVLVADDKVPHAQVERIMGICKTAKLTHVKRVKTAPAETAASTSPSAPAAATPAPAAAPAPVTPEAKPTPPPVKAPIDLDLRPDAKVDFEGQTLTLDELKPKLQEIGKTTPTQPFVINGQEKVKPAELKKVTAMFHSAKLTKVTVTPAAPLPKPAPAVAATPPPPPTPPPAPLDLAVRADGKVDFQGATLTLDELKPKLQEIAKATPNQPLVVKRKEKLEKGQLKKVVDVCNASKLKVTVDKTAPPAAPAPSTISTLPPTAAPAAAPAPPPPAPPPKPLPPAMLLPINLDLRPGGKVDMQGQTYAIDDLKIKLEEIGLTTPKQPIVVVAEEKVARAEVKKLVALCVKSKLTDVTIAKATPPTAPAVAHGAKPASLPASSSEAKTQSSTSVASASVAPATPVAADPAPAPKHRTHASSATAPISTGPEFTVP